MDSHQFDHPARPRSGQHTAVSRPASGIPAQTARMRRPAQSHLSRGLDDFDDNHLVRGYD